MSSKSILTKSKYWIVNQDLSRKLGIPATIFLSELLNKYEYHNKNNNLISYKNENGYFFMTVEDIEDNLGYGRKIQKNIIDLLKNEGIIKQENFGTPQKRYFKIDHKILEDFIELMIKNPQSNTSHLDDSIRPVGTYNTFQKDDSKRSKRTIQNVPKGRMTPYIYIKHRYINNRDINIKNSNKKKNVDLGMSAASHEKSESSDARKSESSHATSSIRTVHNFKFNFSSWTFEDIRESDLQTWRDLYTKIDVDREIVKMQEWVKANPTKAKTNWRRFISNWLNRSQEREYNRGSYHSTDLDRKRSQFEIRHFGLQTDHSPRDPSMTLDCSNWKPGDDDK